MKMLKCKKCNMMTDDEVGFCKNCANPLPVFNEYSDNPDIPGRRVYKFTDITPLIIFFVFLFVGGLGLGIFLLTTNIPALSIIPFVFGAVGIAAGVLVPKAMIKDITNAQKTIKEILDGKYSADIRLWNSKPLTEKQIYKNKRFDLFIKGGYEDLAHLASVIRFIMTENKKTDEIKKTLETLPAVFEIRFTDKEDRKDLEKHFNELDPKVEYEIVEKA
jgi:hypothetical protein